MRLNSVKDTTQGAKALIPDYYHFPAVTLHRFSRSDSFIDRILSVVCFLMSKS